MGSSSKTKRDANDDNSDEADIERFSEIVERFRAPYDWYLAKLSGSSADFVGTVTDGNDRKKRKKDDVADHSKRGANNVWMPCFRFEDFIEEDAPVKFGKPALERSAAAVAAEVKTASETIQGGGEEKKENNEELDLSLSLKINDSC